MCGRYTLRIPLSVLAKQFEFDLDAATGDVKPRYNIAPSQNVLAVTEIAEKRTVSLFQWGLIPSWSKDAAGFINARAETAAEKPAFRAAFKKRRCLVLADGYYEWAGPKSKRVPWHFHLKDRKPFAFAGDTHQGEQRLLQLAARVHF